MKVTRVMSMPVLDENGVSVKVQRKNWKTGKLEQYVKMVPVSFVIDVCKRCRVGAGKTVYNGKPFLHIQVRHRKGPADSAYAGEDLCDECFADVSGGKIEYQGKD